MEFLDNDAYNAKKDAMIANVMANQLDTRSIGAVMSLFHATTRKKGLWNRISAYGEEIHFMFLIGLGLYWVGVCALYVYSFVTELIA